MKTKTEEIFKLSCPYGNECQGGAKRVLFVCSAGMLRSATAAKIATEQGMNARSCGSSSYALIPLSVNLIHWAESIFFVNPENHREALKTFKGNIECIELLQDKSNVWHIYDNYNYNDPDLRQEIIDLLS